MYSEYIVLDGDSLESISERNQIPVYQLLEMNELYDMIRLTPGDRIKVPDDSSNWMIKYTIKKGDTLSQLAREYATDVSVLMLLNGLDNENYLYEGEEIYIPKENVQVYFTKDNDTLRNVLNETNMTSEELMNKNQNLYLLPSQAIIYPKK